MLSQVDIDAFLDGQAFGGSEPPVPVSSQQALADAGGSRPEDDHPSSLSPWGLLFQISYPRRVPARD